MIKTISKTVKSKRRTTAKSASRKVNKPRCACIFTFSVFDTHQRTGGAFLVLQKPSKFAQKATAVVHVYYKTAKLRKKTRLLYYKTREKTI